MASLTLEAAYRALKQGRLAPVYYVTGDPDILKSELISDLVNAAVDPAARDFNLDSRSAADLDGESLHALVETPPMLADRRAVVVRGLEQWRSNAAVWKVLLRYVAHPNPGTLLILVHAAGESVHAALAGASCHVHVEPLGPDRVRRWVARHATRVGLTLEPDAVEHLVAAVGGDLSHLATELDKLAAARPPDQPVTVTDIGVFVGIRRGETMPDWVDAVLARDTPRATGLLDVVLPQGGINGVRMLMALGSALVGVRLARAVRDGGSVNATESAVLQRIRASRPQGLGDWKAEAGRWTRAATRWTGPELDQAVRGTCEADRLLKSSVVSDERGILLSLILQLHRARAAA